MSSTTFFTGATAPATVIREGKSLRSFMSEIEHALTADWDGHGAQAVTAQTCMLADKYLARYGASRLLTDVAPGNDGSLSFVWENENSYIYLDVGPRETVHIYIAVQGLPKFEGVTVASDQQVQARLDEAFLAISGQNG